MIGMSVILLGILTFIFGFHIGWIAAELRVKRLNDEYIASLVKRLESLRDDVIAEEARKKAKVPE